MALVYYLRHQAAGVLSDHPFLSPPTAEDLDPLVAQCLAAHGSKHPKTGEEYWTKIVCIDTSKKLDDPERSKTLGGACGCSPEEANRKASGHCPIREGDIAPELCEHGVNDLAKCDTCGPYIKRGYDRVEIPRLLKGDKFEPAGSGKRVLVAGSVTVENK